MASTKVRKYRIVASSFKSPIKLSTARKRGIRISTAKVCTSFNRLGAVFESVGHIAADMRDHLDGRKDMIHAMHQDLRESLQLTRDQKAEDEAEGKGKQAREIEGNGEDAIKEQDKKKGGLLEWLGRFLKPFEKIIAWIARTAISRKLLQWIADPKNADKLINIFDTLKKVGAFIMKWASFAVGGILDGLAGIFGGIGKIKNGKLGGVWDLIKGLGSLFVGIIALKGLGYLLNPFSLISDIMNLMDMMRNRDQRNNQNNNQRSNNRRTRTQNNTRRRINTRNTSKATRLRYQRRFGPDAAKARFSNQVKGPGGLGGKTVKPGSQLIKGGPGKIATRIGTKFLGKGAVKAIKGVFGRIPIIGSLITVVASLLAGEPLGKALFRGLGAALGGVIGSFIPIPVLGTMLGEAVGIFTADLLYEGFMGKGWKAAGAKLKEALMGLITGAGKIGKAIITWLFGGGLKTLLEKAGTGIKEFFQKGTKRFVDNFPKRKFPTGNIGQFLTGIFDKMKMGWAINPKVIPMQRDEWKTKGALSLNKAGLGVDSLRNIFEKDINYSIPQMFGNAFTSIGMKGLVDDDGEVKGLPALDQLFNPIFMAKHIASSFFGGGEAKADSDGGNVTPQPKKNMLGKIMPDEYQSEEYLAHRDGSDSSASEFADGGGHENVFSEYANAPVEEETVKDVSSEAALNSATEEVEDTSGPVPVLMPTAKVVTINSQGTPKVVYKNKTFAYIE